MINLTRQQVVELLMIMKTEMRLYTTIKATDERMAALDFAAESLIVDIKYNLLYEGRSQAKSCADCILDGTDACPRGAGRATVDDICDDFLEDSGKKENNGHWIDNADSYICPRCRLEVNNPAKYEGCKCPRCGFQDRKDKGKDND